jgi:hypothetical protein
MRIVLVIAAILLADPALSHSWYEPACCSDVDCAPVADGMVEDMADGVHVQGYGVLSYADARLRWSQDDQDHMCITRDVSHKLLCVYRRPKDF